MKFTEQIRKAIEQSGVSRYRMCKDIGLDQGNLSNFMSGKAGLSLESLDKLADYVGFGIAAKQKKRSK